MNKSNSFRRKTFLTEIKANANHEAVKKAHVIENHVKLSNVVGMSS